MKIPTISEAFFKGVFNTPKKMAVCCEGEFFTYSELGILVSQWSCSLKALSVNRGDHVGVLLTNSIEFIAFMLVAADLGIVLVPIDASLPVSGVHKAFISSKVRHIVSISPILKELKGSESLNFSFINGVWLSVDQGEGDWLILAELIKTAPAKINPTNLGQIQDSYILTMTSGSTGDPKPIILTQQNKMERVFAASDLYGITSSDIILAATPLYHSLAERLVLIPLVSGGTSILLKRFSPKIWLDTVDEQLVTFTIAVSSQLGQIAKELKAGGQVKINHIRCIVSSSALLNPEVKSTLLDLLPCDFHECYGTSEIAIATNIDFAASRKKQNSVGTALTNVDLKILTKEDKPATCMEEGEIVCKTPMLFGGYFNRPVQTKNAMWGEYFRTGDIGCLDRDGYLYFRGREKDVIITGGINVYPGDIESVVNDCHGVKECAAFAAPDQHLGEVVALAIVPEEDFELQLKKIRHHCAVQLADFQQPRKLYIVEKLPRNKMGKIQKQSLIRQFCQI